MSQPKLITKPFASDALPGYVNEIPKENPVGAPEQNASWSEGFPPITMTDIDDGGLPPNGEDMNGVLRAITEHNLFIGGGGVYEFTDEYITEVGGYSKGAVLISDDKTALWMSIQDNNTQNFNGATKTQWRRIAFTELDSTLASIQNALNTKADKSVTITAGDGLTGGGTLAGNRVLAVNSSVVRTDRTITAGTGLSGGGNLSTNRTLSVNYGTTAGTAAQGNDSRITGAAQKSASLSDLASASAARQNLGLGTAATRDVGTGSGNVMGVGAFGVGMPLSIEPTRTLQDQQTEGFGVATRGVAPMPSDAPWGINSIAKIVYIGHKRWGTQVAFGYGANAAAFRNKPSGGNYHPWNEFIHTGNILHTTGQSTQYPMTQKAVTDALNTKTNTSTQVIAGTGLSGGGDLSANRTLSIDSTVVRTSGNQSIGGTKTFSTFPVTPSSAPTASYQVANKKYVDDSAIGVGQTWQNVTGSRVAGTTYTNSTGKPIQIQIAIDSKSGDYFAVGGIQTSLSDATNATIVINTVIPVGATYMLSGWATLKIWMELR